MFARRSTLLSVIILLTILSAGEVFGQHRVQFSDGDSFKIFGPSEHVVIDGVIDHIGSCSEGTDDFLFPAANVYIVEEGTVTDGSPLVDAIGIVHTIVAVSSGAFVGESLGFTEDGGSIGEGRYSIVIDECQDGTFQEGVDLLQEPAFEVIIGPTIPPVPGSFDRIKEDADNQVDHWAGELASFSALLDLNDILGLIGSGLSPGRIIMGILVNQGALAIKGRIYAELGLQNAKAATIKLLKSLIHHYQAIADDPPDPDFEQLVLLGERKKLTALEQDPLSLSTVGVGRAASERFLHLRPTVYRAYRFAGHKCRWILRCQLRGSYGRRGKPPAGDRYVHTRSALGPNGLLDTKHWIPPFFNTASTDTRVVCDHYLMLSTPETEDINVVVENGTGTAVFEGTVSNSEPRIVQLGTNTGGDYNSITNGAGNILTSTDQLNNPTTEGLVVTADEPVYANVRHVARDQGLSLTAKGRSARGTRFRAGVMRDRNTSRRPNW
jgi:hypothetical protein